MGKIIKLDDHLSNMIAAGEVVEKPSSVVKELVENAIDAGASSIIVNLLESGTKLIEIIDNGSGMSEEDAKMCFVRHATSKIKNEHDLFRIMTLGFRGEAIPSIASVSKFSLFTCDGVESTNINYNAGKLVSVLPCAMNKGTKICVENLFYNVPARLKYLRSLKTELNSISYTMEKFILANPNISFKFTNDNKVIYQTNGNNNIIEIFGSIYGLEVARNILDTSYSDTGYKIKAYVTKNNISRSNNLEITTVINGRFIKSQVLNEALVAAYKTLIPEGRYPIALLYIDIDPLLIDVNVHPSKMTIKIANERQMGYILTSKIKELLVSNNLIPDTPIERHVETYKNERIFDESLNVFKSLYEEPKQNDFLSEDTFDFNSLVQTTYKNNVEVNSKKLDEEKNDNIFEQNENSGEFSINTKFDNIDASNIKDKKEEYIPASMVYSTRRIPNLNYIGTIHATYLLFEGEDGLYIMDQHAAAERVNYEYYYNILANPSNISVPLLVSEEVELTSIEKAKLKQNISDFESLGFKFSEEKENSYLINGIPTWLHIEDISNFIHDTLAEFDNNINENIMKYRDTISKQIACKASLKANHNITRDEVNTLLANLSKCNSPFTCPHGRPTIIKISVNELEKMFLRIM